MAYRKDLTGRRFGLLTVTKYIGPGRLWEALCDCGNTTIAKSNNLQQGNTKSCGCLRRKRLAIATTSRQERKRLLFDTLMWQGKSIRYWASRQDITCKEQLRIIIAHGDLVEHPDE